MSTTTIPAVTVCSPILAIDLGKYKSVACIYQQASAQAEFRSVPTVRSYLQRLLDDVQPAAVVIEACSLAGWVKDFCDMVGLPCHVANTASEAWKFKHTKRKTDRDDALRLAQLFALGQLPEVSIPPKTTREWRALIATRQKLVGRRVSIQNRIRAILVGQGLGAPVGAKAWASRGLQAIGEYARPLPECSAEKIWRGLLHLALIEYGQVEELVAQLEAKLDEIAKANEQVRLLETIPGVGSRTAEAIVAHLHDPQRFENGKQVSAYAGLVPRQYQSGETDHRGRISKRGPALLRKLLVQCAWAMLRYNAWAKALWQRLTQAGKVRRKQAIVALARKLLVRCWAMLRDGQPWRTEMVAAA